MQAVAAYVRELDPRLKMAAAMALGPGLWLLDPVLVAVVGVVLFAILRPLTTSQPLGSKMVRSLFVFIIFWVALKSFLDVLSGLPPGHIVMESGVLAIRLASLLMLGLSLSLSTSARSLGLALSWFIRPLVGRERAWKLALSLALMIHFLPLCLSAMAQTRETLSRRCPGCGFRQRMAIIPQALLRNLGQKTWNQTLAVAGRGLENPDAWTPDFAWTLHDTVWALLFVGCAVWFYAF
ncbi:cobalt transporter [Pseudodesulfovibrio sp.]|nr:cobalt transporter [Pseudodesulfovibrio sp.]